MNYFPLYIGDYGRDTADLSLAEHGAFLKLLMTYYATELPLPAENPLGYRLVSAMDENERFATDRVLTRFFPISLKDGLRHNSRADDEIAKSRARIDAARSNGTFGGRPRKTQRKPTGLPSGNPDYNPDPNPAESSPTTNNQQEQDQKTAPKGVDLCLKGVPESIARDFKALRSRLRAPITETAMRGIRREATKAGITFDDALTLCCERSWRGFKAEWVLPDGNAKPSIAQQFADKSYTGTPDDELPANLRAS